MAICFQGTLRVWSMTGGGVSKSDNKALDIKDDDTGVSAEQLALLMSMDVDQGDFFFTAGNINRCLTIKESGMLKFIPCEILHGKIIFKKAHT